VTRAQLLGRVKEAWEALEASYAGLSSSEMTEAGVTGDWSVKDIIAHVTAWEEETLKHLPIVLAGKRRPRYSEAYEGIDGFNAMAAERKRDLSISEVLRQRDETHRRLIEFIEIVPEASFARETRFRRHLRLDTYTHYPKHAEAIRKWRARRRAG
jgi:hypothetical protein